MRIRGQIGEWPVDLTLELEPHEWAQLRSEAEVPAPLPVPDAAVVATPRQNDGQWAAACEVLRQAGTMNGPALLDRLEALTGSTAAGKRLLVRLRHSREVRVESGVHAPVYHWVG